jgi:hypothetical protein
MRSTEIKRQRFSVDVYNQWKDLTGGINWYDFTLIDISGEYSPYKGSAEITIGLIGFVATFVYTYDFEFVDKMTGLKDEVLAAFDAEHPGAKVQDPLGVLDELD